MPASKNRPIAATPHNHQQCIHSALENAQRVCNANNARLTPIREKVLRLVCQSPKPLGAYDILSKLNSKNKAIAPPTVYRALIASPVSGLN